MSKVVVTGHSTGIGAALFDAFKQRGDTVVGLSKSTGCDLLSNAGFDQFRYVCSNSNILINCARIGTHQRDVMRHAYNAWRGKQDHIIVNISSLATWHKESTSPEYTSDKAALDAYVKWLQIHGDRWPANILLRPGYVDTPETQRKNVRKMDVQSVVKVVMFAVDNARDFNINDIVFSSR